MTSARAPGYFLNFKCTRKVKHNIAKQLGGHPEFLCCCHDRPHVPWAVFLLMKKTGSLDTFVNASDND